MRKFLHVWRSIGASSFVLSVIESGYKLPFVSIPLRYFFSNHKSAVDNRAFVCEAIELLLLAGSAVEVKRDQVHVCSPLGVVPKKNGKRRLILDLRFLNKHLAKRKFKFEDLRVVAEILQPGDWFFTFDLRNGYHHVDIFQEHWKYLAFSFTFDGKPRYFLFCSLPFGLSTSPYVFTKLLRPVVSHWWSQGIRISVYLDDGIGTDSSKDSCSQEAQLVRGDLYRLGLLVNEEKSNFEPRQKGEHLGFILDLTKGEFSIPPGKIDHLFNLISLLLDDVSPTARDVSRITGTLISMELALGPIVRLRTRALYAVLNSVHCLSCKVALTREAVEELYFWRDNFFRLCGKPIWRPSPKIELLSYSDASNVGWAGFIVQFGTHIARGNWLGSEALCSSSFREIRAIRFVLQSFSGLLAGKECKHRSDNQSVCSILSVGSSKPHLQKEAVAIYSLCHEAGIRFSAEWIPRHFNFKADYWSKVVDTDDWMLNPVHFRQLDILWGPHTVDRFASHNSFQLPRFCSRWWCPGTETVDAFTVSWGGENNWLVPPVFLIPRVINHMKLGREQGTLIIPFWQSAHWWPLVSPSPGVFHPFVLDWREIPLHESTFLPGSAAADLFGHGIPSCRVFALRIVFP